MQLSARGRYAVMAMVALAGTDAARGPSGARPVRIAEIAAAEGISQCFLEQLFGQLRRAGLVASARGPGGGYRLARPAAAITVAEVLGAVEEELDATRCNGGAAGCAPGAGRCATHDLWAELGRQIHLFLGGVTLQDVISGRVAGRAAPIAAAA